MEMMTFRLRMTGSILVAAISLAGCGGSDVTQSSSLPSTTAAPSGIDAPSDAAPSAMVVTRTGGFAGVNDVVEIAADGTAQVTSKTGETRACTPSPTAVEQLRAIDLALVGSGTSKSPIADGFVYSVRTPSGDATVGEGDNEGIRAEFVLAAAAVVSSCLEAPSAETE
jgi:hypothetical protein